MNNWWQTETAHAITATCVGMGHDLHPPKNVAGMPVPGFDGNYNFNKEMNGEVYVRKQHILKK